MDFRFINEDTIEQVQDLWDYCFEKKEDPFYKWYFSKYALKQNKIMGGFSKEGKLLTMLHLNPYPINFRGTTITVYYIVGVATDPALRGKHIMGDLLKTSFNILRAAGIPFVLLMPINAGIYLPYNFSFTYLKHKYNMPLRELKMEPMKKSLTIERVFLRDELENIKAVYAKKMKEYNGFVFRDTRIWENTTKVFETEQKECVVIKDDTGLMLGYAIYFIKERKLIVEELIVLHYLAKKQLIKYFSCFIDKADTFEWRAEDGDITYLDFSNQNYAGSVEPFMMTRIIDVNKALELIKVPKDIEPCSFNMFIKDEFMKLNSILAKVSISSKGIELTDTANAPDVVMDINSFNQLYFGTYSAHELSKTGKISCGKDAENLLKILAKVFPKTINFINEYF